MTAASVSPAISFVRRPTRVSGLIATLNGIVVVTLIAGTPVQRRLLAATVVGVAGFVIGGRMWRRHRDAAGAGLATVGCLLVAVATIYAALLPSQLIHRFELVPGLLGIWTLAAGLLPLRFRWSRPLIDAGAGLLFVAVLTSGVVRGASAAALVFAAAATILAWDAAENAVSVGGQVGDAAATATARAELVHLGISGGIAGIAVAAVLGVVRLGIDGLPFATLAALLVAGIALTLAYHR